VERTVADGKYEVVSPIGSGGMGAVYEVRHTGTGRHFALKLVREGSLETDTNSLARFEREVRAAAAVDSEHIVQVVDAGLDPASGRPFMVMELLRGEDLEKLLQRVGPLDPDLALRIAYQAAIGLRKAHEVGVVHRDIKTANLFLAQRDDRTLVKVLDFGIAKLWKEPLADATAEHLTTTGSLLGTPAFMSPEQLRGARTADARTDLWSLGVVLYRSLSRAMPHTAETLGELLLAVCTAPARPLQEVAPWVAPEIAALVHRALAIDADRRFQSAREMGEAILALLPRGPELRTGMLAGVRESRRAVPAARLGEPPKAVSDPKAFATTVDDTDRGSERRASDVAAERRGRGAEAKGRARRRAPVLLAGLAALLAGLGALWVPARFRAKRAPPSPPSASRPPARVVPTLEHPAAVLVLGIANHTGDPRLDDTLEIGLQRALLLSPVIVAYARAGLRGLARDLDPQNQARDESLARKLLARDGGLVVTVRGSIDAEGHGYVLRLSARDAAGADVLAGASRTAGEATSVMPALGRLAWDLRGALGEALPTGQAAERTTMSPDLEADHEYAVGMDLYADGRGAEAVPHHARAVEIDPSFAAAHWALGSTLDTIGHHAEAEKEYVIALRPGADLSDFDRLLYSLTYALQHGDYDQAILVGQTGMAQRPYHLTMAVHTAIAYNYRHEPGRAVELGRRLTAVHPSTLYLRTDFARWLLSAGELDESVREAEEVIRANPHPFAVTYETLGQAEAFLGRRDDALASFAKLEAADPSIAGEALADVLIGEGRLDDATASLTKGIDADRAAKRDESAAAKLALLAEIRLRRHDVAGALSAARSAIEAGSRSTICQAGEVEIEASGRGADSATFAALAALRDKPAQEPRAYRQLLVADSLRVSGRYEDALRAYDEAQGIMETWLARFGRARTFLAAGRYEEAEQELRACVAIASGVTNVYPASDGGSTRFLTLASYHLAAALDAQKKPEAREAYQAFLAREAGAQHEPLAEAARRRLAAIESR
jgi:eukaryotic-like serine/threonine-protein kinase